ncbi:hypothetical protein EYC80_009701 [Monilinia laxa]|uniref:Piwi domain-containing protein n=1 Tax=Monilinia laxa TaxID=61186 RepID=A0A5N6JZ12_MONLA|nr:hypothetical protein EYC80_009701 [Monilinia laxa]
MAPPASLPVTCAKCEAIEPQHRRTKGCSQDPDTNPWPRFDTAVKCDFCEKSHESSACPKLKENPKEFYFCGKCGYGWHFKKKCLLRAEIDEQLEQYTLDKYLKAKERRDDVRARNKDAELDTQVSSSKQPASGPLTSAASMNLSGLRNNLPGQSTRRNQQPRSQRQIQIQGQLSAVIREGIQQQREKREAAIAIKNADRKKWTQASLSLAAYPSLQELPPAGPNSIRQTSFTSQWIPMTLILEDTTCTVPPPGKLLGYLRGVKVAFVGDRSDPKKMRAIRGIENQTVSTKNFTFNNEQTVSVWQHMSNEYAQIHQNCSPDALCINLGGIVTGTETWYPVDMLNICMWQPAGKKPGLEIIDPMLRMTTRTPAQNQEALRCHAMPFLGIPTANSDTREHYQVFGLDVTPNLLILERTRRLHPPKLTFRNLTPDNKNSVEGSAEMPAIWAFSKVERSSARDTISGDAVLYSDIKWWGDCISGIPTVCVSSSGITKGVKLYADRLKPDCNLMANIALKINFKLGGISHRVSVPGTRNPDPTGPGVKDGTVIIGADVTHVGKGQDGGCPSQAGVVATQDQDYMHYLASARLQPHNTEFIEGLQGMVEERLEAYHQHNGQLPAHILFYRDGVGETQYGMVFEEEFPQVRAACASMATKHNGRQPSITLLVVEKRHHARFFPNAGVAHPASTVNLIAGTVVDRDVTDPNRTYFYLQSHDSALETARTGHYVVIIHESGYGFEQLQSLTNNICFMGSRATKGLSVCTPARYADILYNRLRCYMYLALMGKMTNVLSIATVDQYRQNNVIWGSVAGNPWNHRVNNIMFYL